MTPIFSMASFAGLMTNDRLRSTSLKLMGRSLHLQRTGQEASHVQALYHLADGLSMSVRARLLWADNGLS